MNSILNPTTDYQWAVYWHDQVIQANVDREEKDVLVIGKIEQYRTYRQAKKAADTAKEWWPDIEMYLVPAYEAPPSVRRIVLPKKEQSPEEEAFWEKKKKAPVLTSKKAAYA